MTRIFQDETSALRRRDQLKPSYPGKTLVVLHRLFGSEHKYIIAERRIKKGKPVYYMDNFA